MRNKANSKQLLIKSGFWYTISNFLTRAMVFITMPVFTRLMSKTEYGDFYVFASWQSILLIICGLELYGTLNRARFDFPEGPDFDGYITSSLVLSTILTAVVFVVYILLSNVLGLSFLLDKKYMYIMFAYLFFCPALSMFQTKQRVTYKYKLSAAISIALSLSSSLLALWLAVKMSENRLLGRIIGQYGLPTFVGIAFYIYFFAQNRRITLASWKYAIRMGAPLVISSLGSQLMHSSDGLVLKYLCSAEEVSYLSVTQTASHIVLILVQTLNSAWSPWFYDMLREENYEEIKKSFLIYVWGMVICTFAVLMVGPEVISILGGKGYGESVLILPPCILSGVFTALTAQLVNLEIYYKKPEYAAVLTGFVSLANVILDIIVVNMWGYRAVCYATVFCQILLITLHYLRTIRLGVHSILSEKSLVVLLIASVMLIPIALVAYQSIIVRCIAVIISFCIAVFLLLAKKQAIIGFVNSIKEAKGF